MADMNGSIIKTMLPNYFKWIGLALVLFCLGLGIFNKINPQHWIENHEDAFRFIVKSVVLLGLFLIAGAKEKIESREVDESRLKALISAGSFGVLFTVIRPLVDILAKDPIEEMSGHKILIMMLVFYLMMFYTYKRGIIKLGVRRQSD